MYHRLFGLFLATLLIGCKTHYEAQKIDYKDYRITSKQKVDSTILKLIKPYSDSVNKSMNDILAYTNVELQKKQPEGTLGNVMADAMLWAVRKKMNIKVDGAFVNYGGIRLTAVPKGAITRGKIFELAPFDNVIVVQSLTGKQLQDFLSHISGRGGWPVAGITWKIKDKKAIDILINGTPIDAIETYEIANVDYVANGGDDCEMLKSLPQKGNGLFFRDAIIEFCKAQSSEGITINGNLENRVINAN